MIGFAIWLALFATAGFFAFSAQWLETAILFTVLFFYSLLSINIIRPTHRVLIERFGKFQFYKASGIFFRVPFLQRLIRVNITEMMDDIETQEVITQDNLNAMVDLQVYYKVNENAESVKNSQYNVFNYKAQIIALARTTMRNVIGQNSFIAVNSQRNKLNDTLRKTMQTEVSNWGIDIVRCELKEIKPPSDVQDTMNKVLKAQNEKLAAVDFATAAETQADGLRRAEIKKANGTKTAAILVAEGQAQAIKLVNEAAKKYFTGNAQLLKKLEVTENSLKSNSKIIIAKSAVNPLLLIGDEKAGGSK